MALFDDPKKELRRLEEQLRAAEEEYREEAVLEELLEEYQEEVDPEDEFGESYEEDDQVYAPRYQNFANDYGRAMTEALWEVEQEAEDQIYSDEDFDAADGKKKKRGIGEAILLVLLDILLIGILWWGWQQWMG